MHNKGNAWKERRRLATVGAGQAVPSVAGDEGGVTALVSMARATLEVQLEELPTRLAELRGFIETMTETIASVTDVEAAAAEVDQAHAQRAGGERADDRGRVLAEHRYGGQTDDGTSGPASTQSSRATSPSPSPDVHGNESGAATQVPARTGTDGHGRPEPIRGERSAP